jgi:hypothetical protein
MVVKVKVIKRDDTRDKRITRAKTDREALLDRYSLLMREAKQIRKQLGYELAR